MARGGVTRDAVSSLVGVQGRQMTEVEMKRIASKRKMETLDMTRCVWPAVDVVPHPHPNPPPPSSPRAPCDSTTSMGPREPPSLPPHARAHARAHLVCPSIRPGRLSAFWLGFSCCGRYEVPQPEEGKKNNIKEWNKCVDNARAQSEHGRNRLDNLELMNAYGSQAWKGYTE